MTTQRGITEGLFKRIEELEHELALRPRISILTEQDFERLHRAMDKFRDMCSRFDEVRDQLAQAQMVVVLQFELLQRRVIEAELTK